MMKLSVEFSIKRREMFSFLPLINSEVTIKLCFLLLSTSAMISENTINILRFYFDCILQYFHKHLSYLLFKYSIIVLE